MRTDDIADEYRISHSGNGGLACCGICAPWKDPLAALRRRGWFAGRQRAHLPGTALGARFEQRFGSLGRARTIDVANPIFLDTRVETDEVHRSAGFTFGFGHERLLGSRFDRDHKLVASTLLGSAPSPNSDGATLSLATRAGPLGKPCLPAPRSGFGPQ